MAVLAVWTGDQNRAAVVAVLGYAVRAAVVAGAACQRYFVCGGFFARGFGGS